MSATSFRIIVRRFGRFYGWAVFDGYECLTTEVVPRLTRASAHRAAERAARRHAKRSSLGPVREEYRYPVESKHA